MGRVCEHEFNTPDRDNPDYSLVEYDLYARTNLSIRKSLKHNRYEIFVIKTKEVKHTSDTLEGIVTLANEIEGEENTTIECGTLCPLRR